MKIVINGTSYALLKNLHFMPQADLLGQSVPICEFSVDIITEDDVSIGQYAELRDDLDALWALYWITYAEHVDRQTLRIRASSPLVLIDREMMPAVMYDSTLVSDILEDIFASMAASLGLYEYEIDDTFSTARVTGFCPEQTARERLLWVCFSIGAYVKAFFGDKIRIIPIDNTETLIPLDQTYWKPQVSYSDHVTAVRGKYYSFSRTDPQTTDKWVKDNDGTTYIVTEQEMSVINGTVPSGAPTNVIKIDGVYLLNSSNVSETLSHLSTLYFKRTSVEIDVINDGKYLPGDRVIVYAGADAMLAGFIESADFVFGVQAKSRLKLIGVDTVNAANLTVLYTCGGMQLDRKVFLFPVGYSYSIQNPYIDQTWGGHRVIYRPVTETITGTMPEEGGVATVQYERALDLELATLNLEVISVDSATDEKEEGQVITTIG